MNYRNIGKHAEDTAEGAMLAPGESTEDLGSFDPLAPHNKRLIDEGVFIAIDTPAPVATVTPIKPKGDQA